MKYLLNPDAGRASSGWSLFARRAFFKLILIRSHITAFRSGLYTAVDLPAIFGHLPAGTRRAFGRPGGTILLSALGFGEIINSIELIRGLQRLSSLPIVVLSREPERVRRLTRQAGLSVTALPYPYHFCLWRPLISRWLAALKPVVLLCMENMIELRADMIELARARYKTSVVLINAHAEQESTFLWHVLENIPDQNRRRFQCVDMAGVVSEETRRYLRKHGVPDSRMITVNNLKFDTATRTMQPEEQNTLRRQIGLPENAKILLAGSIHPGEEAVMIRAFQDVIRRPGLDDLRLILVPRELYTVDEIMASVARLGFSPVRRTACAKGLTDSTTILIVDTIGELKALYGVADVVILAGSLLNHLVGHNPIEPASLGKPVIAGPYMSSFKDVMDKFLCRNAIIQIADAEELAGQLVFLFENPAIRERMGALAKTVVEENGGAIAAYINVLSRRMHAS